MSPLRVKDKASGEELEVLEFAGHELVLVAPATRPAEGTLRPRDRLEPDPGELAVRFGFTPWTMRRFLPGS